MNYMRIKIARKVAYSLWEFEMKLREEDSEYLEKYSKSLRRSLEIFLKRKISNKDYKTLLNIVSEYGFSEDLKDLKDFLIKELNKIAEQDELVNKLSSEIDD